MTASLMVAAEIPFGTHFDMIFGWHFGKALLFIFIATCCLSGVHPRVADASESAQRVCLISDLNGSYGSVALPATVHRAMQHLTQLRCSLVVGAGDLVAGQDTSLDDARLGQMWAEFNRVVIAPFDAQGVPVLSAMGNHDASAERGRAGGFVFQRERDAALKFWTPSLARAKANGVEFIDVEHFPFFYSARVGRVGLLVLDGSSAGEVRLRKEWIVRQLEHLASDQSVTTRLVVGHLPLVAVAQGRQTVGNILADSRELYELFDRNKVDFYISGHHHSFFPGRVEEWSRHHGTIQLALGALGDGPRRLLGADVPSPSQTLSYLDLGGMSGNSPRWTLRTLFPFSGEWLDLKSLPFWIPSFDGSGRPVELKRMDF